MSKKLATNGDRRTQKKMLSLRIDPNLEKQIKRAAKKKDRTVSWLVNDYIQKGLETETA